MSTSSFAKTGSSAVIPSMRYRDCHAAIDWLCRAFGFVAQAVYDGPNGTVAHAQLTFGSGMIMLGSATNAGGWAEHSVLPNEIGDRCTHGLCLIVTDATAVYETAKVAGAEIVGELREMDYGGKAFGCRDPEGYLWSIGEYDPWA